MLLPKRATVGFAVSVPRSRALDRPRPRRTKPPERWPVQISETNRPILVQMLALLGHLEDAYAADEDKRKHLRAVRQSLALLRSLLENNPRELVLEPEDFVRRSIMLYLDETCWGLLLRAAEQQEYARRAAYGGYGMAVGYEYL